MSASIFTPGTEVVTSRGSGIVADVRATASGKFVFGIEDAAGEVTHFTERALRLANS